MKKDDFKNFVRTKPELIKYVKNGEMTWQKFYEIYDLYQELYKNEENIEDLTNPSSHTSSQFK